MLRSRVKVRVKVKKTLFFANLKEPHSAQKLTDQSNNSLFESPGNTLSNDALHNDVWLDALMLQLLKDCIAIRLKQRLVLAHEQRNA